MKRVLLVGGGSALILALVAGASIARDGGHRGANLFERFDTDGNGEITRAEFDTARDARFSNADADGDGLLTAQELVAAARARHSEEVMAERVAKMIDRFDENGDQALSQDELPKDRGGRMFERVDANGDGIITQAEVEEMRGKRGKRGKGRDG